MNIFTAMRLLNHLIAAKINLAPIYRYKQMDKGQITSCSKFKFDSSFITIRN